MPLGAWLERRRRRRGLPPSMARWPRFDLNDARTRGVIFAVLVLTPVNLIIVSLAAFKGVEAMDSVAFCGQVCHEVMEPEFVAYQNGPHARVNCVACHIGPGADWFVKAKLSGLRQVVAVALNTHSRPIVSPVHNLRPARETCAQCHWPTKFHGDKIEVKKEYAEDEANTESVTTLRLRIGGRDGAGKPTGIHWHVADENAVEYIALDRDAAEDWLREVDRARRQDARSSGPPASPRRSWWRVSGARWTASTATTARATSSRARPTGPSTRPWPRARWPATCRTSAARPGWRSRPIIPTAPQPTRPSWTRSRRSTRTAIPELWTSRQADIMRSIDVLKGLHQRNVFSAMKLNWGHHPDNQGHMEFPGCFRCHDGEKATREGRTIRQDCDLCHEDDVSR